MQAQTSLMPTQPQTHSLSGKYCQECKEWATCQENDLTPEQLHAFCPLREQANENFEDTSAHQQLVKHLYKQYFKQQGKIVGRQFLRLGFQSQYPSKDFRGGGVLSLRLIIQFVKNQRSTVQTMQIDKGSFFFAITAINIAFFMKKYFHLADFLIPIKDQHIYCNRKALKNFCIILQNNSNAYIEMHQLFLLYFYYGLWIKAQRKYPQTLLQFNSLFQQLQILIRSIFQNETIKTWDEFLFIWKQKTPAYHTKN